MAATITIDWHEAIWYLQGVIGGSHLRWDGYKRLVNTIWLQFNEREREAFYTTAKRNFGEYFIGKDSTEAEHFMHMLHRFNPANQYSVTMKDGKKKMKVDAYLYDGGYYINWNHRCAPHAIVSVERKAFKKCINDYCLSRVDCQRYLKYNKGDELVGDGSFASFNCAKCDYLIKDDF